VTNRDLITLLLNLPMDVHVTRGAGEDPEANVLIDTVRLLPAVVVKGRVIKDERIALR